MPKIVCGLSFRSAAFERGERGGATFAAADGSKFPLSRWTGGAKGASSGRTAMVKLVLPFLHSRQKFRRRPATI